MRKNQLTFTIESFGDQATDGQHHVMHGYIDGSSVHKITRDFLKTMHECYSPEGETLDDFIKQSMSCVDTFGRYEVTSRDSEKTTKFGK